jgi:hypothetical protein
MHDNCHWRQRYQGDGREIADSVVRQFWIKGRIDGVRAHRPHEQRLTVGRGPGHGFGSDRAAGPAAIVDHDSRLKSIAQHLRERSRHDVGWSASWKWDNDAELLAGEGLGLRWSNPCQQTGAGRS